MGDLDKVLKDLQKRYGDAAPRYGKDIVHEDVDVIPTGSLMLNKLSGVGGIPRGRVTEIYGWQDSAKSTVCQIITAEAQKLGNAAWIDMEKVFDKRWAEQCGIDVDKLIYANPDAGEQALEIIEHLVTSGSVVSIVVDSVATLVPTAEVEGMMGDATFGSQAKLMSQGLRKINPFLKESNTALIFINQNRVNVGGWTPSPSVVPETTAAGKALGFYASMRWRMSAKKEDEQMVVTARQDKNKIGGRYREKAQVVIDYNGKIDSMLELVTVAVDMGIIEQKGSWFSGVSIGGTELKVQGIENFAERLSEDLYSVYAGELRRAVLE